MDIVNNTSVNGSPVGPRGRRPLRRPGGPAAKKSRGRRSGALVVIAALIIGGAGGVLGEHYHLHHSTKTIAVVAGTPITEDAFFNRLQEAAGVTTIRGMVGEQLETQLAKKKAAVPTDAEVDAVYNEAKRRHGRPTFTQSLAQAHETPADFRRGLRLEMMAANLVSQDIKVTDADLKAYYQKNIDPRGGAQRYYSPPRVTMEVIVTRTAAQAQKALAELTHGTDFGSVAKKYSADRSAAKGGVLPPIQQGFDPHDRFKGLSALIFSLKPGQQVGPRQFAGAWWIIRALHVDPPITEQFDDVKLDCRVLTALDKAARTNPTKFRDALTDFRSKSTVQAFWPQYAGAIGSQ